MNVIGNLVAQQTSDAYAVELPDGTFLKGGMLKLSTDVDLAISQPGAQPSMVDIFKEIDAYLQHLMTSGMV